MASGDGGAPLRPSRVLSWLLLAVVFVPMGCFYGYDTDVSLTRVTAARYPPSSSVKVYFRPPAKDEHCAPIALLSVSSSRFQDTSDIVRVLLERAKGVGADAVFSVTLGATTRTQGELLSELDPDNKPTVYSSHVVTGLAARCDQRSPVDTEPPDGAYGYPFGAALSDVEARCLQRGSQWYAHPPRCAKGQSVLAFDFCDGALCRVETVFRVDRNRVRAEHWPEEFLGVTQGLIHSFGLPSLQDVRLPRSCESRGFLRCVARAKASYTYQWFWPGGPAIGVYLTQARGEPVVRAIFIRHASGSRERT